MSLLKLNQNVLFSAILLELHFHQMQLRLLTWVFMCVFCASAIVCYHACAYEFIRVQFQYVFLADDCSGDFHVGHCVIKSRSSACS